MPKSKDPKTHFEQVPLEIVKKIAEEEYSGRRNERSRWDRRTSGKKVLSIPASQASHGERPVTPISRVTEGERKVDEHRERWMELYKQTSKDYAPATLMKLMDERLL